MLVNINDREIKVLVNDNINNFIGKKSYLYIFGYLHALQKFKIIDFETFKILNDKINDAYSDKGK